MIYSLVGKKIEDVPSWGIATGVVRFDSMLRRVFPKMKSITPQELPKRFGARDVVIADNHLSLLVPEHIRTVVVHHGCAETHFARDPQWRTAAAGKIVEDQKEMIRLSNRRWVAPSSWVGDQFSVNNPDWMREVMVIPHWVDRIDREGVPGLKPLIIGDWRDYNKGSQVFGRLADRCPQWEFRTLSFTNEAGRRRQYGRASLFLNLSLCEGACYAMCDAEAAKLPIVTTDTGLYREFRSAYAFSWRRRDDLELLERLIGEQLAKGRDEAGYYEKYSFENWAAAWREAVS